MHVVDVSGTTNANGEITVGYDPINDVEWLKEEIELWVFSNLWERWGTVAKRQHAKSSFPLPFSHVSQLNDRSYNC